MKKRLLFLLPAVAMVLAGCGNGGDTPTTSDDPTTSSSPTSQQPTSTPAPGPYTPVHAGTEADPLDSVDAYHMASELAESGSQEKFPSASKYYIKDVVTSVTECSPSYGNVTFSFGEPATPFTGYRLKVGESKQAITSEDQVAVGDTVTIYSDLLNFHGTMETNDGYIVSIEMPAPTAVTVTAQGDATKVVTGGTLQMGYATTPARAGGTAVYSVECDPADCATIDPATGLLSGVSVGTATVTVTVGDVHGSKEISVALPDKQLLESIEFHAVAPVDLNSGNAVQLEWDAVWAESTFEKEDLVFSIVTEAGDPLATINQSGLVTISTINLSKVVVAKVEGAVSHVSNTVEISLENLAAPTIATPAAGTVKLGAYHRGRAKFLFSDGTLGGRYGNSVETFNAAYGYTLAAGSGEGKWTFTGPSSKLLGMKLSGTYHNFAIDTQANLTDGYEWTWDATNKNFSMVVSGTTYILAYDSTSDTFTTFASSSVSSTYSPLTLLEASLVAPTISEFEITASATSMVTGDTLQLGTKVIGLNSFAVLSGVEWASSATTVADVSSDGLVSSHTAGNTTITATKGTANAELDIAVIAGTKIVYTIQSYVEAHDPFSSGTKVSSIALDSNITATAVGTDNNTGKIYVGTYYEWRFYGSGSGTLNLTPGSGFEILSASGQVATANWGAPSLVEFTVTSGSVSYSPGSNFNVKSITVIYRATD